MTYISRYTRILAEQDVADEFNAGISERQKQVTGHQPTCRQPPAQPGVAGTPVTAPDSGSATATTNPPTPPTPAGSATPPPTPTPTEVKVETPPVKVEVKPPVGDTAGSAAGSAKKVPDCADAEPGDPCLKSFP